MTRGNGHFTRAWLFVFCVPIGDSYAQLNTVEISQESAIYLYSSKQLHFHFPILTVLIPVPFFWHPPTTCNVTSVDLTHLTPRPCPTIEFTFLPATHTRHIRAHTMKMKTVISFYSSRSGSSMPLSHFLLFAVQSTMPSPGLSLVVPRSATGKCHFHPSQIPHSLFSNKKEFYGVTSR